MSYTYPYELGREGIVVNTGKAKYMLDTGAPFNVSDAGTVEICGETSRARKLFPTGPNVTEKVDSGFIGRQIGVAIDGLIGKTVLEKYGIIIDPAAGTVNLSRDGIDLPDSSVKASSSCGGYKVKIKVNGNDMNVYFDTGASCIYTRTAIVAGCSRVGGKSGFNPLIGYFSAGLYSVPCEVAGIKVELMVGTVAMLDMIPRFMCPDALIGHELLRYFKVYITKGSAKIYLEKL